MKIAYLAHRIPYPPNKGDKIRSFHHLRYLAQRHDVSLFAFVDDPGDMAGASHLRDLCREVCLLRLRPRAALVRGALRLAAGGSLSAGFYRSRAMWRAIDNASSRGPFDVAWAYSSAMAPYVAATRAPWRVADFVDVDSEKWRQFALDSSIPISLAYHLEARRLRQFEAVHGDTMDRVLFVSHDEAALYGTFAGETSDVRVVPNGVDTSYFRPHEGPSEGATLLFTGALDYRPNVDAVLYCAREVLPLVRRTVPSATLLAVGHRPSPLLLRAAEASGGALRIAGSVPDVRPYFGTASVFVAPLRLGRGVQNKVLEAMAMGVSVVATPRALAGLGAEAARVVITAESASDLAAGVIGLLGDEQERRRLASAALALVQQSYRWDRNVLALDDCLRHRSEAIRRSDRPAARPERVGGEECVG